MHCQRLLSGLAFAALIALPATPRGSDEHPAPAPENHPLIERFLAAVDRPPPQYRAWRRLEASSGAFRANAWMEAWTEVDAAGRFSYEVVDEGGTAYIRNRVFQGMLEGEEESWRKGDATRAGFNQENYRFVGVEPDESGLQRIRVKPLRKDLVLVDGALYVQPSTAELVRVEGRLARNPSFWTRRVNIVQHYGRVAGVRMLLAVETSAYVLLGGRSDFVMTYSYESINGSAVETPAEARRLARQRAAAVGSPE